MHTHVLVLLAALVPPSPSVDLAITTQGRIVSATADAGAHGSPLGTWSLRVTPRGGDFTLVVSDLVLESTDGARQLFAGVRGTGYLVSELGHVIVTEATHSEAVPVHLTVFDAQGVVRLDRRVPVLTDPTLSADGDQLAFRSQDGIEVVDLVTWTTTTHANLDAFAVAADGSLAGVEPATGALRWFTRDGLEQRGALEGRPRELAFSPVTDDLWAIDAQVLVHVDRDGGAPTPRFRVPGAGELRDLVVAADALHLGIRLQEGARTRGRLLTLDPEARHATVSDVSATVAPPAAPAGATKVGAIPWPLAPDTQHPIGNTYAEFQDYGSDYLHPGVDVLGSDLQPVYAVADGVVKAVLTTSGQYHWRVATGDAGGGTSTGYLYAHLVEGSITVNVGDTVTAGQYLGDLVAWPVAGFTHCHFARIEDTGTQWFSDWLCTDNPHLDWEGLTESQAPVFEDAVPGDLFAFCVNNTSSYLDPNDLSGKVDIIAHVSDRLDSSWRCSVQSLRYSIHPLGQPDAPVVDDRIAVDFDMMLDTYRGGAVDSFLVDLLYKEDGTCDTDGDYSSREFFHILTNSDGDDVYTNDDLQEAWDTTQVPNGAYEIVVVARDAAGNATSASMVVTVDN